MKPIIRKEGGFWTLTYRFPPRQFWLYGLSAEERRALKSMCEIRQVLSTWTEAIEELRFRYKNGDVAR